MKRNLWLIAFCFLISLCLSCEKSEDNSELQNQLIAFTKLCNKEAKSSVDSPQKIQSIKEKYFKKIDSIKTAENWSGKITMLDLDENEAYSKDTVIMRIGIENTYDKGDQDYFSFAQVKPISKQSELFKKLNKIEKNSEVKFSGKLVSANLNTMTPGYEFSNFYLETDFSDIEKK
ncbi:hypothetical protein LUD75_10510 [Epilithonimonas sp. JDS]|uniref:hypothetical protein n=1 Tax=Epilithonimonas sp. JDS TaxID=2902797 RepID=UPI001E3FCF7A|nr:hypothetical protein [Epilithonimonas sp. JDS]MCD9855142.1 hypothetical protein [Epilithonimonas sp. JDS]